MKPKTIVVSAVNLNVGGTLTILRDCLAYLSGLASNGKYRVVAIVFDKNLALFPHVEYIETQWPKKNWLNRLWYEYVSMKKISRQLSPVYLWFSLHDTTPNVEAERRAVYCHNPFPFYKWKMREWLFTPKIVMFGLFSKYIYRANIYDNTYVVVQQQWIKHEFKRLFELTDETIVVAPPSSPKVNLNIEKDSDCDEAYSFVFASSPNSHKNFECICQAAAIIQNEYGMKNFNVYITVKGNENAYAKWLYKSWGNNLPALHFIGFLDRKTLFDYYSKSHCMIFPSKVETWGLPITEFAAFGKPMLIADLPYAHETAGGTSHVAFFDPENPKQLARQMKQLMDGDFLFLQTVPKQLLAPLVANTWEELFEVLLSRNIKEAPDSTI
jgi:glycosyltransferase involved in cell wall biosynthesis